MTKSFLFSVAFHGLVLTLLVVLASLLKSKEEVKPVKISIIIPQIIEKHSPSLPAPLIPPPEDSKPTPIPPKQIVPLASAKIVSPETPIAKTIVPVITPQKSSELAPKKEVVAPSVPVVAAPVAPAPKKVNSADTQEAKAKYLGYIRQSIDQKKTYPKNAKRLSQQGTVTVKFTVDSDGAVSKVSLAGSSNFDLLDNAAVDLLKTIGQFKPFPSELGQDSIEINLPIEYSLR